MTKSNFPTTIDGKDAYFFRTVAWLIDNASRLGIATEVVDALKLLYGDAVTPGSYVYCKTNYDNAPGRKDSKVVKNLETASDAMKAKLMEIYNDIPASKWTDDDRVTLERKTGLPHKPTTPIETIKDVCVVDIEVRPNGLFNFGIRLRNDTKRYNIPTGADAVEVRWAIVESEYRKASGELASKVKVKCESYNDCTAEELFRKAKFQLSVDPLLKAFELVCWVRWTNTVHPNLAGEWSGPHTKTIL
jgi:hypothetical protein